MTSDQPTPPVSSPPPTNTLSATASSSAPATARPTSPAASLLLQAATNASSTTANNPQTDYCCDELLLDEGEAYVTCPTYQDGRVQFDARIRQLGFDRSPSQPDTVGDGNCGIYALLDQLNLPHQGPNQLFEVDDFQFAR